jgi:hypothetical protein|tara:strand:- start:998 stop:1843 length:846 start_codon:yes stop_codon:yes gene_type:complete
MGKSTLNLTERKNIVHAKSDNTEIKIYGEDKNNGVSFQVELFLNPKHDFPADAKVTLYPYQTSGGAFTPISLGTVGKSKNLNSELFINGALTESLLFRLKVSKDTYILGLGDEIDFFEDEEGTVDKGNTSTLLPIITDDIATPYKIKMAPFSRKPPTLILNRKSNIQAQLRTDPHTMILIYTGAVREILTNFCIDERYNDDTWKDEWVNFIHKNQGDPEADPPEPYFKDGSTENINEKTVDWINQAVETISNLKLKQYENKTLMELVVEMNKNVTDFRVED